MAFDPDQPAWACRLEAKLDAIIQALTADVDIDEDAEPQRDLDGNLVGGERDTTKAL
jgi:hypothetical protein